MNRRKAHIIIVSYITAALLSLGAYSFVSHRQLELYRRLASYSAQAGFDMTVGAVEQLGTALQKSLYVTQGDMSRRLGAQAYAGAQAAETAMAALPFDTRELDQLSAFLNQSGDYVLSLAQGKEYEDKDLEQLEQLAAQAEDFTRTLRQLQSRLDNGLLILDSRLEDLHNVGLPEGEKLSQALLDYGEGFDAGELEYDGRYCKKEALEPGGMSQEEMLELAARAAGVQPMELKQEYSYEGPEGRCCYSAGGLQLCMSNRGLMSMGQSRLVSSGRLSTERAREKAEDFLELLELEPMALVSYSDTGSLASFYFVPLMGNALRLDSGVKISIALDDGSVYAYNGEKYFPAEEELSWDKSREQAAAELSELLSLQSSRAVTILSPGGREQACYQLSCIDRQGRPVEVYVDAVTGEQCRIDI